MKKVLPIGIDNFCDIISNNCYYVDKTNYIKTVLTTGNKVLMLTRPRRFGKSLFIDTVRCFLQLDPNQPGNNCINKKLFSNLEITKDANFCNKYMGQYPVISISLKDIEGANFNRAYAMFASKMQRVISQYAFLLNSPHLDQIELSTLKNYLTPGFLRDIENIDDAQNLLNNLIIWLFKHFERRVVVLIDEYDVPLAKAAEFGYYDQMLHLIRSFLAQALNYLTVVKRLPGANSYSVRIPNEEIRDAFKRNIKERFSASNQQFVSYGQNFAKAALTGNPVDMGIVLEELLKVYVSVRDLASKAPTENYYHGFLVALLACAGSLAKDIRSNSEAGHGFADLMFTSGMGPRRIGVIIEIKRCNKNEEMYSHATEAINQIKTKRYNDALDKLRCSRQFIYGIAFCRKDFEIVVEEIKPMFA